MPVVPTHSDLTYKIEDINGRQVEKWLWQGQLHSVDDLPSMIVDGGVERHWHTHGILHRCGAPAIIAGATEIWYYLGAKHRADGPAHISPGLEYWYLHGKRYNSVQEWVCDTDCNTPELAMLKLKYM